MSLPWRISYNGYCDIQLKSRVFSIFFMWRYHITKLHVSSWFCICHARSCRWTLLLQSRSVFELWLFIIPRDSIKVSKNCHGRTWLIAVSSYLEKWLWDRCQGITLPSELIEMILIKATVALHRMLRVRLLPHVDLEALTLRTLFGVCYEWWQVISYRKFNKRLIRRWFREKVRAPLLRACRHSCIHVFFGFLSQSKNNQTRTLTLTHAHT